MTDSYAKYEITEEFCSGISSLACRTGFTTSKGGKCPSCGRDTSQPNLPYPSVSKTPSEQKEIARGHVICVQCGGLGAGLLDGLLENS